MNFVRMLVTMGLLLLLAAVSALAQAGGTGQTGQTAEYKDFGQVDRDGDNLVTESEIREALGEQGYSQSNFAAHDEDGDQALNEPEYEQFMGAGEAGAMGDPQVFGGEQRQGEVQGQQEYGITREQGTTGGVAPIEEDERGVQPETTGEQPPPSRELTEEMPPESHTGIFGSVPDAEGEAVNEQGQPMREGVGQVEPEREYAGEAEQETGIFGDEPGPENYETNGEMGDQEGRGPAEVPNIETYGGRDYGVEWEYGPGEGQSGQVREEDSEGIKHWVQQPEGQDGQQGERRNQQ